MAFDALTRATHHPSAADAFVLNWHASDWDAMAPHLVRHELGSGVSLIHHLAQDRVMYLLESGVLQVFLPTASPVRRPVAILRAGAIVGEPALFSDTPRMAQVDAMAPSVVWSLERDGFDAFADAHPVAACKWLRACGAVMAVRMAANLERGCPVA